MPTSWSIEAAHNSSRSPSAGSISPPRTSESSICSDSFATCSTCVMSDSYWIARLRTAALADVLEARLGPIEQRPCQEHALTQASLGRLDPIEAADLEHRLEHDCRGEDDVAATGLDPGSSPRSSGGSAASSPTSALEHALA